MKYFVLVVLLTSCITPGAKVQSDILHEVRSSRLEQQLMMQEIRILREKVDEIEDECVRVKPLNSNRRGEKKTKGRKG